MTNNDECLSRLTADELHLLARLIAKMDGLTDEEIVAAGMDEVFEDEGGRRHEYLEAHSALGQALGIRPWQASPADVPDQGECTYDRSAGWQASWAQAQGLRRELLAVLKAK